jgi:hypothetical protein
MLSVIMLNFLIQNIVSLTIIRLSDIMLIIPNAITFLNLRSIQAAEERARLFLKQRRVKIATDLQDRRQRQQTVRQKLEQSCRDNETAKEKLMEDRESKFQKWSMEKNLVSML